MYTRISNKRKVILCRTKWRGISYDIDNAHRNTPLAPESTSHARPRLWFRPVYLQKFKVGSQKSVTLLWLQRKIHRGRWHYLLSCLLPTIFYSSCFLRFVILSTPSFISSPRSLLVSLSFSLFFFSLQLPTKRLRQ